MRKLSLLIVSIFLSSNIFSQSPSVTISTINLDNDGLYNNWHNTTDTFFVIPIKMDSFLSGIDSFAFNITYDAAYLEPIMDLTSINSPGFILLMNYLGGAEFAMVDGQTIQSDTFLLPLSNTNNMMSISYSHNTSFTQGMYNNCLGTLLYLAFKRKKICESGAFQLNFWDGEIGGNYINPSQINTFIFEGNQTYSADNGTLNAINGEVTKQQLSVTISENLSSGSIESLVEYGWAPYSFLWNNGQTTQNVSITPSFPQYVIVEDYLGCIDTSNILLISSGNETIEIGNEKIRCIKDLSGRTSNIKYNIPLLYIYDNGNVAKKIIISP